MHKHHDNRHRERGFRGDMNIDDEWERPRPKHSRHRPAGDQDSFPAGRIDWRRLLDEENPDED